jgi:NADH-quinone oxidoreductase subunit M
MSLWLVLVVTLLTPLAALASFPQVGTRVRGYAQSLLLLEATILGGFVALDLFLFYVFWELSLVPMFLIIGVWGDIHRAKAALKFFISTLFGSLLMLVAILYLVAQFKEQTGHYSFELSQLKLLLLPVTTQVWLFAAFALAFAIKVPMFPVHIWSQDAYVQANTGGSIMLSAVMAKLATYGFVRFAMPLFPAGSHRASTTLALLAVVGIIYGAYCAWVQADLKRLIAYASVSHLGFVILGIYTLTSDGLRGSLLQMVNHAISTAALFLLAGVLYDRRQSREVREFGGLAKIMPAYAVAFMIVTMSTVGLPTTNGFVGELMILAGAFMSEMLGHYGPLAGAFATTGMVLAPLYILHAVWKLFWGPLDNPANQKLTDLNLRERLLFAPIVILIFYIGLFPNHVLRPMAASVDRFALEYVAKLRASDRHPDARGLLDPQLVPDTGAPEDRQAPGRETTPPLSATLPRGY